MMESIDYLSTSVEKLECQEHKCNIDFVVTGQRATKRFLCSQCMESMKEKSRKNKHIMGLRDYFAHLKRLAKKETLRDHPEESLFNETDRALDVTERLTEDLNLSLGSIKTSLRASYDDILVKLTTNAAKCTEEASSNLNKALKKNLLELSSIERNLKIMKDGGSPTDIIKILDMAHSYITKKASPDNSLYDLLNDLNPLESAQSTHKRLTDFADRYMLRKRKVIKAIRAIVARRFEKEEKIISRLFSQRSSILKGMDDFLAVTADQADKEKKARIERREKKEKLRRLSKSGRRRSQHAPGKDGSLPQGSNLTKRKPQVAMYDPKKSFERVFGKEKPLDELEKKFNVQRIEGAAIAHNRLTDALSCRRTEMKRHQPNMQRIGLGNSDSRQKARKSFTHYRTECPLERVKKATIGTHLLKEETHNVLTAKNTNVRQAVSKEKVKEVANNHTGKPTMEVQPGIKTSQSYREYMEDQKMNHQLSNAAGLKENQPVRSKSDLLEGAKGQIERAMMLDVPIKKLNANDPRRKMLEETALQTTNSPAN